MSGATQQFDRAAPPRVVGATIEHLFRGMGALASRIGVHSIVLSLLVLVPTAFTAVTLLPELTVPVPSLNDDATHFLLIQRASDALASGENALDHWVPQLELGFPWFIYYQPLAALAVVALQRAILGTVDLLTVFNAVRYLILVGFPLTVFWSLRRMGVAAAGAAVAAAVSPLLSGDLRYGFEYDSYVWRGFGMFTQLAAMPLSFVALALIWRALEPGPRSRIIWASLVIAAMVMTHLIYSYMMAITAVIMVIAGAPSVRDVPRRAVRLGLVSIPAALLTAWLWVPFMSGRAFVGVSPYLQTEKFDSYGGPTILGWLVTGDLLDHGRWPVITALLGLGIVAALLTRGVLMRAMLGGFVIWLVLYFGPPTLGGLIALLPMHEGLLVHRFIGSVDLFAIVLVGLGAAWAYDRLGASRSPLRFVVVTAAVLLLLVPAMNERGAFYSHNSRWMRQTFAAINADADARTILDAIRAQPPGRVFAGFRSQGWGPSLNFALPFNSVRFADYLVFNGIPVVGAPYSSLSLNADLMWDLAVDRPEEYDLLDARYVVGPANVALPSFLKPLVRTSRYTLYESPTSGVATYGALIDRELVRTQTALFVINRPWFNGPEVAARRFHRFDFPAQITGASAGPAAGCARPSYSYERVQPSRVDLVVACPNASTLVLKLTYHPNWHVIVDGLEVPSFMTSPSYLGVALPAGQHVVTAEYRSTPIKAPLLLLGFITLAALGLAAGPAGPIEVLRARARRARTLIFQARAMMTATVGARRADIVRAALIVVSLRVTLGVIGWLSIVAHPRQWATVPMNHPALTFLLVPESSPLWPLVAPWQRFDALWYEYVASKGYGLRGPEAAFAPLFPALEHLVGGTLGNYALAGLLISTVAFVVALLIVQTLVARDFGADVARRTVTYVAVAPTAFFFLAGYSEALFLALSAGGLLAARTGRLVVAGILVGLAILCRHQGVLLLAPLAVECALRSRMEWRRLLPAGISLAIPLGVYGLYQAWLSRIGFPGGALEVAQVYWRSTFGRPLQALEQSVHVITTSLVAAPYELLNLAAVLVLAASIPVMLWKRFPLSYTVYAAASLFAMLWHYSAFTPLMSDDRFLIVVVPFFVVLALPARPRWVVRPLIGFSLALLAILFVRFAQYEFVG